MSRFHWQSHIDEVDDDGIYCHSRRNNVVVAFGTLSSFFTYLLIVSGVVWVVCPFCRWWKKWQHSSWSSVIGMRSHQPQFPRCSTPLNPPPLFLSPFPPLLSFSSNFPFLFLFLRERRNVLRHKIQKTYADSSLILWHAVARSREDETRNGGITLWWVTADCWKRLLHQAQKA